MGHQTHIRACRLTAGERNSWGRILAGSEVMNHLGLEWFDVWEQKGRILATVVMGYVVDKLGALRNVRAVPGGICICLLLPLLLGYMFNTSLLLFSPQICNNKISGTCHRQLRSLSGCALKKLHFSFSEYFIYVPPAGCQLLSPTIACSIASVGQLYAVTWQWIGLCFCK